MPELPDVAAYITALESRIIDQPLKQVRLASAFLLRTAEPPIESVEGQVVRELRRLGKRILIGLQNDLWLALHLMIAGRLHWRAPQTKIGRRHRLAAFSFSHRSLSFTPARVQHPPSL